jgi:TonB family protein
VVVVRVVVDEDGTAGVVTVRRSVDPALDAEAVRVVQAARYVPATLDGHAVMASLALPVRFTLAEQ